MGLYQPVWRRAISFIKLKFFEDGILFQNEAGILKIYIVIDISS